MATEPVPKKAESEQPVVIAKPVPTDELGETLDQFLAGMQSAGLQTIRTMLAQIKAKADDVITKLDGDVDADAPKKG